MKKYYITCGDIKDLRLAESPEGACFDMFSSMSKANRLSEEIRVSQIGHEKHDNDIIFNLPDMFCLWLINVSRSSDGL
tara:strand:+ start:2850 stop:3083 length:234 start_codon:yes stop_codon:yes gene_type:complete